MLLHTDLMGLFICVSGVQHVFCSLNESSDSVFRFCCLRVYVWILPRSFQHCACKSCARYEAGALFWLLS